jgi:hypothetical protein
MQQQINNLATHNCSIVDGYQITVSDPPTQAKMQTIANVLSDLITSLQRSQ